MTFKISRIGSIGGSVQTLVTLNPTALLNAQGWTLSGQTISLWADQSGNGRDFGQSTSGVQPVGANYDRRIGPKNAVAFPTDRWIGSTAPTLADVFGATGDALVLMVVDVDEIVPTGDPGSYYLASTLFGEESNYFKLGVYDHGGPQLVAGCFGGSLLSVEAPITPGIHLVQCRKVGATMSVRVDDGTEVTGTVDALFGSTTGLMRVGRTNEGDWLSGSVGLVACWESLSDGDLATARSIIKADFHLASSPLLVMPCGDSIVLGPAAPDAGGWRAESSSGVAMSGRVWGYCGPLVLNGRHRGVSGEKASDIVADLSTFAAQLTAAGADAVIMPWGGNDLGEGTSDHTALLANLDTIHDCIVTTLGGSVKVIWSQVVNPTPAAGSRYAHIAEYDAYNAAVVAHAAAKGAAGTIQHTVTGDADGTHPDTAGYVALAAATVTTLTACL